MATASAQRFKPPQSTSITSSSDNRPTVVLCSSKDDHLLAQDICILCGSLGKDDEGNLISCSQCGQCYHPYCVNIKGLKVVVSKGWRCLDCTVCETCGQPGDEGKLLLCDECELSYHTYCLNPPLEDVPPGAWKCHWCVVCQKCKSHAPGINSEWQKNYTECGPCASHTTCPKCHVNYTTGDLILQCTKCSRWLHAECDSIYDEDECALARELGYSCLLCRPQDETPLYMLHRKTVNRGKNQNHRETESASHDSINAQSEVESKCKLATICSYDDQLNHSPRPQSAPLATSTEIINNSIKRPASSLHFSQKDIKSDLNDDLNLDDSTIDDSANKKLSTDPMIDLIQGSRMVDGVYLSETGVSYIKSQKIEPTKRQRAKRGSKIQKLDDCSIEETNKDDDVENKSINEKLDEDGKKKRTRKLSKAGIGGFAVRQRGVRVNKDDDFNYSLSNDTFDTSTPTPPQQPPQIKDQSNERSVLINGRPKRVRKKPKKKTNICDQYPSYLQEAFFGKPLLMNELKMADDKTNELNDCTNLDLDSRDTHEVSMDGPVQTKNPTKFSEFKSRATYEADSKLNLNTTDSDIMDAFLNDSRATDDSTENNQDILNINLDLVDPLDSSVVEDVLNGLDNTQQSTSANSMAETNSPTIQPQMIAQPVRSMVEPSLQYEQSPHMMPPQTPSPRMQFTRPQMQPHNMLQVSKVRPPMLDPNRMQPPDPYSMPPNTPRPMTIAQRSPFSPQSPYPPHQMNANPSTPPVNPRTPGEQAPMYHPNNQQMIPNQHPQQQPQYVESGQPLMQPNQMQYQQQIRSQQPPQPHFSSQQQTRIETPKQNPTQDWEAEEALGTRATKSAVLYTNTEHPNLKLEIRSAEDRFKQIQKLWRQLPADKRKPYVEKARENRSASKVNSKPVTDVAPGPKKSESPLQHQTRPQLSQDGLPIQSQQMHMVQQPGISQSQDTRWRQPMPVESSPNRFPQSPHQTPHHIIHEPNVAQPMSPTVRPMVESHFDPGSHQMIPPQTPSPQMQYSRPPNQQHSMIQVSRVRPPSMEVNRLQTMDPYSIPPSTPRPVPVPVQQRSPYSPQSPFPPHSNAASSTPPVTPRTPSEHVQIYQHNQPPTHQQSFVEPHTTQLQQPTQYQQMRQPQYQNQQRLAGPNPVQQYGNQISSGSPVVNRPMGQQQVRGHMAPQQPIYQQPQQFRQNQPVRYASPHQDSHQHVGSPLQQNQSPNMMQQPRMQRPVMTNQVSQQTMPAQRMMQPRPQQQQINQGNQVSVHQVPHQSPVQQHQMHSQGMQQQPMHQQVQHQAQNTMQQAPVQQTTQQMQYSNIQITNRIDAEDSLPLLDDEDALRDLGADFNILEFADPEHEKGASTSSGGKNNIDLDPELEDIFDQDQLDEKRASEQLISSAASTAPQQTLQHQPPQHQQQNQQMMYQPMHTQVQQHIPPNQNFHDGQQSQVSLQNSMPQQAQYSPQRQPQFTNQQQRILVPPGQHTAIQPQMVRQQAPVNQARMQLAQQQQQQQPQQISYMPHRQQQQPQQQPSRYQSPMGHDMHGPQSMQQNHINHQSQPISQVQMQRGHQIQTQAQYNNVSNFVENQPQQQQMQHHHQQHHHPPQQQIQYSQQGTQQNMVYTNHQHNTQMNQPRRQFQTMHQQQQLAPNQQQHQNYSYQQPQAQQMIQNQHMYHQVPNQQMMRGSNDIMMHDKNPIIGETITSMEFNMYEPGPGQENQAANFFDSCDLPDPDQDRQPVSIGPGDIEQVLIPDAREQLTADSSVPLFTSDQQAFTDNPRELVATHGVSETDPNFNTSNSGRLSSCSNPQDLDSFGSANNNGDKLSNNPQGQNQLLKQLLATCPAADGPNQEVVTSNVAPVSDPTPKVSITSSNQNISKQAVSGIPTISFQMDSGNKSAISIGPIDQTQSTAPAQLKTATTIATPFQSRPSITSTGVAPSSSFEIKTYNVGQQVQDTGPSSASTLRISQISGPISHNTEKPFQIQVSNRPSTEQDPVVSEPVRNINLDQPSVSSLALGANKTATDAATAAQLKAAAKISAAKKRKSDYMAKRRADLEKEPTPPPREIKPKKKVRGPNKRSRAQLDGDDIKTNDSNSNTSETSHLITNGNINSAPPRKRGRKNQKAKFDSENKLSSFASKLSIDLPPVNVSEPFVKANMNVASLFSSGDLNLNLSKLRGQFGQAIPITNTLVEHSHNRGRRKIIGYYHEEFPKELSDIPPHAIDEQLISRILERDCDSPSSIISASSSEQDENEFSSLGNLDNDTLEDSNQFYTPDLNRFGILRKVRNCGNGTEEISMEAGVQRADINNNSRPKSPSISTEIILPVTQIPLTALEESFDLCDNNKENFNGLPETIDPQGKMSFNAQPTSEQSGTSLNMRLKDHGNVSVSLSLTTEEADGVKRVLSKMPELIDNSEQTSIINGDSSAIEMHETKADLNGSVQLITGTSGQKACHTALKFDEMNYVPMNIDGEVNLATERPNIQISDVKPEICCRCKTVIVNKGIRKHMNDLPEQARLSLDILPTVASNQSVELVYCSVDCYATSFMQTPLTKLDSLETKLSNTQNVIDSNKRESIKRKWHGVSYARWSPTFFEPNKIMTPVTEDARETVIMDNSTFTLASSSQIINHGDSSIDSNESDNSTSYSQSTSGKLGNSMDSPCNTQETISNYLPSRDMNHRVSEIIPPWPEGLELIQVKPYKPMRRSKVLSDDSSDISEQVIEMYEDVRKCVLCHEYGDGESDGPARLLNFFIDGWVHLNCALWSLDVYELANGALMNVELACRKAMTCSLCRKPGATLKCFKPRCPNYYHFVCALKEKCSFYEDKSVQCRQHSKSSVKEMTSFVVKRRVYINRDEQSQVAEMIQSEQQNVMRVGSLVFLNIGQLLPHQLGSFHDQNNIFPVGFKVIRYYWSYRQFNKRCKYICFIEDREGKPRFRIVAQEFGYDDEEFIDESPHKVWAPIIDRIVKLREGVPDTITTFRGYIRGEDLFGLNEPSIVRILESLPGVETLTDYEFKFGRSPLLELPLAINPTGCARTEPKLRTHFKRPYTIHTANNVTAKSRLQSLNSSDSSSPYIKQFVHSKSSQYRKMKSEWRNNVVLARSRVQGLGLYAARDIEKHTMVIEYIGMLIRNEIAERYERIHEANNRGIYMFRLDEDRVIDATLAGGLARYINHSCNPNCMAEAVEIDRERKILIIANRKILKGEELGYDYKLAIEDDQHKISCLCGAATCKKWMN